jgi:hypothetical protein
MVVMLSLLGMDVVERNRATIVCRVATLWFAVALGFCAFAAVEAGVSAASTRGRYQSWGRYPPAEHEVRLLRWRHEPLPPLALRRLSRSAMDEATGTAV